MKSIISSVIIVIIIVSVPFPLLGDSTVRIDELVKQTEEYLEELNDYEELSLAVAIAYNGVPVLTKAYGLANRSFNIPNTIDTKFNLASMNKMFTSVAIMQLVQKGKLNLDDKIGDHIPDFPNAEVKSNVTVYQLLTHTAGMGNIFSSQYGKMPRNKYQKIEDYFPLFVADSLRFTPGSKYEYSNAGYIVLGYLIEKITGQDYHSYVKEHIYIPAGMNNTDCYDVQYPVPNLAIGYTKSGVKSDDYKYKTIEYVKMTKGSPAGGGYSTVEDLIRFGEALLGNILLNKKYTDMTTTGKVPVDDIWQGGKYCFGFLEQIINGHRIIGHSGNFSGIRSTLKIYVDDGISIAILSNFDRDQGAEELEYFVREKINGDTDFTRRYLKTKKIIREIETSGYSHGIKTYDRTKNDIQLYESIINSRGYVLLRYKKYKKALDIFKFNIFAFPNSSYVYDSLAQAYLKTGDKENAIKYYKKALEIDPQFESSIKALKELGVVD
ncbi:MAG: serine hydrolase [bacterium]|nr:MAG: serine hydrolase [bacterium]